MLCTLNPLASIDHKKVSLPPVPSIRSTHPLCKSSVNATSPAKNHAIHLPSPHRTPLHPTRVHASRTYCSCLSMRRVHRPRKHAQLLRQLSPQPHAQDSQMTVTRSRHSRPRRERRRVGRDFADVPATADAEAGGRKIVFVIIICCGQFLGRRLGGRVLEVSLLARGDTLRFRGVCDVVLFPGWIGTSSSSRRGSRHRHDD